MIILCRSCFPQSPLSLFPTLGSALFLRRNGRTTWRIVRDTEKNRQNQCLFLYWLFVFPANRFREKCQWTMSVKTCQWTMTVNNVTEQCQWKIIQQCQWTMSVKHVSEQCQWNMSVNNVIEQCQWTMSVNNVHISIETRRYGHNAQCFAF